MSFTDQKPRLATKEECEAPWSGYKDGRYFRCHLCGHRFQEGDQWRWVRGIRMLNFKVCGKCDTGDDEDLRDRVDKAWEESKERFWYLHADLKGAESELSNPIYTTCPRCKEEFRA